MEFIGLLGLLGLFGFFSGRGVERKFDNFKKNFPNNDSRIAQNEQFIADLQREIERLNFVLKNYVTSGDLNNFSRQVQNEVEKLLKTYATISSVNELEQKVSDLQSLQRRISALEQRISALEKSPQADTKILEQRISALESSPQADTKILEQRISALENSPQADTKILEQRIAALENSPQADTKVFEQRISALEFKIAEQNKLLAQYQNYFYNQQNLNSTFDARLKKFEQVQPPPKVEPAPVPAPPKKLTIKDFQLKKNNVPLFSNEPQDAAKTLATLENLSGIMSFLESSNFDKKESFIRLIKNYRHNLQKFSDKVKRGKFDEDNFSEEISNAFFSVLQKYFLANLPVSIYRGNAENPKFYAEFLAKINEYLSACHVYTELVEPKKVMQHDDIEKMNIVKKDTANKSEDKIIDEVERLPYFLEYLTDDNEMERLCFDGSMVVLKFDGGAK